jgi:hypothetical protein
MNVNGRTTKKFGIEQGVRQGCPVALYLFLVIGKILNTCIKKEVALGRIKGIILPCSEKQQIINQYANDSSLTLKGEEAIVEQTVSVLDTFNKATSLVINQD